MSWDTLAWRRVDADTLQGAGALADLAPILRASLEEAAGAVAGAPVRVTSLEVADIAAPTALPEGIAPVATFELLGSTRRPLAAGVVPGSAPTLGAAAVDAASLAEAILRGLDTRVAALAGEGIGLGAPEAASFAAGGLLLFRLGLVPAGAPDTEPTLVAFAVDPGVPVELATHVVALQALATATPDGAAAAGSTGTASAAPGATAGSPGAGAPGAGVAAGTAGGPAGPTVRPHVFEELAPSRPSGAGNPIELLYGVSLHVTAEIGRTSLPIRDVLALSPGSIVELDKLAGEKVDVLVNGHFIASGEVVVVDENFGVRITDVASRARRLGAAEGAA